MEIENGVYHVVTRGVGARFVEPAALTEFTGLLAEAVPFFRLKLHAYALTAEAYQLVVETPDANLSQAMQWLNLSLSSRLKRVLGNDGPIFRERFRAVLIESNSTILRVSRFVHLSPIGSRLLAADQLGGTKLRFFDAAEVQERLRSLREFRGSSYRAYAGYATAPEWLHRKTVYQALRRQEGQGDPAKSYRAFVEQSARMGLQESIFNQVRQRAFLGQTEFVERMRRAAGARPGAAGQNPSHPGVSWEKIVAAVEKVHGRSWDEFANEYGDPGRDLALYAGRLYGRYTLKDLAEKSGGLKLTAVGQAVARIQARLAADEQVRREFARIQRLLRAAPDR